MIRLWAGIVIALTVAFTGQSAMAEKRIALVIGNSDYTFAPLTNPKNDAKLMARTLRNLNFDVIEAIDASQKAMKTAIRSSVAPDPSNRVVLPVPSCRFKRWAGPESSARRWPSPFGRRHRNGRGAVPPT